MRDWRSISFQSIFSSPVLCSSHDSWKNRWFLRLRVDFLQCIRGVSTSHAVTHWVFLSTAWTRYCT